MLLFPRECNSGGEHRVGALPFVNTVVDHIFLEMFMISAAHFSTEILVQLAVTELMFRQGQFLGFPDECISRDSWEWN